MQSRSTMFFVALCLVMASCTKSGAANYRWHRRVVATTFWVGEVFDARAEDGSQVCSTYDSNWAKNYSGVDRSRVAPTAQGCAGAPTGGCDGVTRGDECLTEVRRSESDFYPTTMTPLQNPFYLDLPFDDLNNARGFATRCQVIPWAMKVAPKRCKDRSFSYMKNRWVRIVGPSGTTCYGQIQDAGPGVYDDAAYVFGEDDPRPRSREFNNAGMDVSPALNGCLGFRELNGQNDRVDWQFVDDGDVPDGPWRKLVTTSPPSQ